MPTYKLHHHTEEFQCPSCGTPVYVGDKAYEDPATGDVFCCKGCAGRTGRRGRHPLSEHYYQQGLLDAEDPDYDSYPNPAPALAPDPFGFTAALEPPPPVFHPGGAHRYGGRTYPGSGRMHHHGLDPARFHPGGGVRYAGDWHPGGGHYEANNPYFAPEAMQYVSWPSPAARNPYFAPEAMQYVAYPNPRPRQPRRRKSAGYGYDASLEADLSGDAWDRMEVMGVGSSMWEHPDDVPILSTYWVYDRNRNLLGTLQAYGSPEADAAARAAYGAAVFRVMMSELADYEAFLAKRRLRFNWQTGDVYYDPSMSKMGPTTHAETYNEPPGAPGLLRKFITNPAPFAWPSQANPCYSQEWVDEHVAKHQNPGPPVKLSKTAKAAYHHLKVVDVSSRAAKNRYTRFRTGKWRGGAAGILAVYGVRRKKGPRGGKTELYQLLFPKDRFSVAQAEDWVLKHGFYTYEVVAARPAPKKKAKTQKRRKAS